MNNSEIESLINRLIGHADVLGADPGMWDICNDCEKAAAILSDMLSSKRKRATEADVNIVVEHYRTYHSRSRPGAKERKRIGERLRDGYSVDDLKLAIDGCHRSPFHCGDNSRRRKYQTIELIFRDSDKVNSFIELGTGDVRHSTVAAVENAEQNEIRSTFQQLGGSSVGDILKQKIMDRKRGAE